MGMDADAVLKDAGINLQEYKDSNKRVPLKRVDSLLRLVIEQTGNPSVGLDLVEYLNPSVYGPLGLALLCSSTLRKFCKRLERYFDIVSSLTHGDYQDTTDGGQFIERTLVNYPETTIGIHADIFCAMILRFIRIIYRPDYNLERLDLSWTPPEKYHDKYHRHFGCQINFGAPLTIMYFAKDDLDILLSGANASLAFQNDQAAKAILADLGQEDLQTRIYTKLIEFLPDGDCSRRKIASSLHMSESKLQKKLRQKGTSYRAILDHLRIELSHHYLDRQDVSIIEIAFLLGYSDGSCFCRAFKRLTKISPAAYRDQDSHIT